MEQQEEMSLDEYNRMLENNVGKPKHKYNARKTEVDGIIFPSAKEARRYQELLLLERNGDITQLTVSARGGESKRFLTFPLQGSFRDNQGKNWRGINYVADFGYIDIESKEMVIEDTKGMRTPVYKMKAKMFRKLYPQYIFKES